MAITFPASPSDGDVFTNTTTGVKYIYNATDGVWKTHVWPTNTNYLQLSGGTLTGDLSLGTNDLTAQDITTTGSVTVGNGLIVSDGNVVMAAGHGIDFSATTDGSGTVTSELFDDYEQGSFTPVLEQSNANPTNIVYSYQRGKYTKVGNVVTIWFDFNLTSFTAGNGRYRIGDLPFNAVVGADHGGYGCVNFRSSTAMELTARLNSTSSYHSSDFIDLRHINNGGTEEDTSISSGRITGMSFYYTE